MKKRDTKSNDPTGERPTGPAPQEAPPPPQLRDLHAKLLLLKAMGVGSYKGPDGETINFWPDQPALPDENEREAAREEAKAQTRERDDSLWPRAAGGMRPRPPGHGTVPVTHPAMRSRFPDR